jgi:hypothetical protein
MIAHTRNEHSGASRNAKDIRFSTRTLEFAVYLVARGVAQGGSRIPHNES